MQLSDVLKDTDAVKEAIVETDFNYYLKILSELPDWKKKEIEETVYEVDFTIADLIKVFG